MTYKINFINLFGYLYNNQNGITLLPIDELYNEILQIKQKSIESIPIIVAMDVMEGRVYTEQAFKILDKIKSFCLSNNIKCVFILDGDCQHLIDCEYDPDYIFLNYLIIVSYIHTIGSTTQKINQCWNSNASTGLFIPGKLIRPHRIKLLCKLWEIKKLDTLTYSCIFTPVENNILFEQFIDYDIEKFEQFKKECSNILDYTETKTEFASSGYPFDTNLYANTSYSLLTESDFSGGINHIFHWIPKLTEKTYRAIVNKHPFIHCWYPGMIKHIENLGYKSFKEYLKHPDYNDEPDLNRRLDLVIDNILNFDTTKSKFNKEIKEDTEFNFEVFNKIVSKELVKVQWIFDLPQVKNKKGLKDFVDFMFPIKSCIPNN